MARVSSSVRQFAEEDEVTRAVRAYVQVKDEVDALTRRKNDLRDYLMDTVEQAGYADELGNQWLELEGLDGVSAVKRERRTKASVDEDAAQRILAERGLVDTCFRSIQVVDEDAVMAAVAAGQLSDQDIDEIFPQRVTYALVIR